MTLITNYFIIAWFSGLFVGLGLGMFIERKLNDYLNGKIGEDDGHSSNS